ncbi:MAG: hypothetical protein NC098_01195 [Lachnoclostridium sp.]|nr:hypothetical protein [Lachnoclostridium sp.]
MDEDSFKSRVDRIKVKADLLTSRYRSELDRRLQAQARVAELEAEVARQQSIIRHLELSVEELRVASVLTPDHGDVEATRAFLSGLVREIDKCIAILSI